MILCVMRISAVCWFLLLLVQKTGSKDINVQDQTTSRLNTLSDDADDIQRQLDNEARDRFKYGRPKTIWVFHIPTHVPEFNINSTRPARYVKSMLHKKLTFNGAEKRAANFYNASVTDWDYKGQTEWSRLYAECGGMSQAPIDLPFNSLIKARGARTLLFSNYNVKPMSLTLHNDGNRVILFGSWAEKKRPLIYGGAAHSRRYLFHYLTLHWPSEHTIGGLQYPLETQAIFVSAEYKGVSEALEASPRDPQAFLAIASIFKFSNYTQPGVKDLIKLALEMGTRNVSVPLKSFSYFLPSFKEYVCYQGSLTTPPCTESVLWMIRGRTLHVTRDDVDSVRRIMHPNGETRNFNNRLVQPANDRKAYFFCGDCKCCSK